jgi:hypothetical protein
MRHALSGYWPVVLASLLVVIVAALPQLTFANNEETSGLGIEGVNNVIKLVVWTITAQFFGFLVWVGGGILDYSISTFIIEFGRGFQIWGLGFAVNNLWTVVRDLFNLTFIFALVYIGFRMILDSDDGGAQKAIVNLVIAALLVNFSLFFTKAIIDFTNITATQVANVLYQGRDPTTTGSISGTFMTIMNLPSVLGPSGTAGAAPNAAQASWAYIIGTMVLSLIAAFSFMAGAILIGIRFIVLNYFMVISPVMFIGRVFPFLQSWQDGFWSAFLKNAFFAPAFLLMLYFSVYILENLGGLRNSNPGLHETLNNTQANVGALAIFLLAGGFLIGSVLLAQKMSVVGGAVAVKVGKNLQGRGQRLVGSMTLGAGAAIGQRTIGRAANRIADSDRMKGWAARSSVGAAAFKASNKVADASFDGRNALSAMGVKELGKGTKGGYDTRIKEAKEADKKFAESLGEQKLADTSTEDGRRKRIEQTSGLVEQIKADNTTEGTAGYEFRTAEEALARENAAVNSIERQVARETQTERAAIERLQAEMEGADPLARRDIEAQITDNKTKIAAVDKRFEAELKNARSRAEKAQQSVATANEKVTKQAEARYTYARQLQLMERRRREAKRYSVSVPLRAVGGALSGTGAVVAGAGALATTGAVAAGYVASSMAGSYADSYAAAAEELEKIYGKDGTKKVKNKKDEEERKKLAKMLKGENKDENKKKEGDDDEKD